MNELRKRLQAAADAKGCKAPSHRLVWLESEFGYTDTASGLHYVKGPLMNGHRRPYRRRKTKQEELPS